ncbi:hypothetical protein ACQ3I4_14805 [Zafaria sp. Z1313]|nr:hypothetical protein [Zafaria sp. J156]MEE1622540.1 hypothetical protein [Zafaria sp. J156]
MGQEGATVEVVPQRFLDRVRRPFLPGGGGDRAGTRGLQGVAQGARPS